MVDDDQKRDAIALVFGGASRASVEMTPGSWQQEPTKRIPIDLVALPLKSRLGAP